MDSFNETLHYINKSGRDISFIYRGTKYIVKCWRKIELPDHMYEFIESSKVDIELDYEFYVKEYENELQGYLKRNPYII